MFAHRDFDPTEERFEQAPHGFDATASAARSAPLRRDRFRAARHSTHPAHAAHAATARAATIAARVGRGRTRRGAERAPVTSRGAQARHRVPQAQGDRGLPAARARRLGAARLAGSRFHADRSRHARRRQSARHGARALGPLPPHHAGSHLSRHRLCADNRGWRRARRDHARAAVPLDDDAKRAQHRAALLRSSGVRSSRAHHARADTGRVGAAAGGFSRLSRSSWRRALPRGRVRSAARDHRARPAGSR